MWRGWKINACKPPYGKIRIYIYPSSGHIKRWSCWKEIQDVENSIRRILRIWADTFEHSTTMAEYLEKSNL